MKRYRLLKDLPGCGAGTIFCYRNTAFYHEYATRDGAIVFAPDHVEIQPSWFEEVKEEPELKDKMKLSYLRRAQQKGLEGHAAEVWAVLMTLSDQAKPNSWEDAVFANATCLILDQNAKDPRY